MIFLRTHFPCSSLISDNWVQRLFPIILHLHSLSGGERLLRGCSFSFMWPEILAFPKDWQRFVLSIPGEWTTPQWKPNRSLVLASLAARHRLWGVGCGVNGAVVAPCGTSGFCALISLLWIGFPRFWWWTKSAFSCKTAFFFLVILSSLEGLPTPKSRRSHREICICAVPQTAL